jgi:glycosyltransferase involved in cell wall biosynthesis
VPAEIAVLIAARNEERRLGDTLAALGGALPGARLIVADDASSDRTPQLARAAGGELVRSERRLGKGGASTLAARRLGDEAAVVLLCDGDLGASAARLTALVERVGAGEADIAIATFARPVGGGFGVVLGFSRRTVARHAGRRLEAPLSGQRALTARALRTLLPFAPGFGMETAMDIAAIRAGLKVVEVELDLEHRATGRNAAGFAHRARQLIDIARVYRRASRP